MFPTEVTMPIEIRWLVPNHILISRWYEVVTRHDMFILIEELERILQSAPRPIHTLLDMTEAEGYEEGVVELYIQSPVPKHPNRGHLALVHAPPHLMPLVEKANTLAGRTMVHLFDDYQTAKQFLLSSDAPNQETPPTPPAPTR